MKFSKQVCSLLASVFFLEILIMGAFSWAMEDTVDSSPSSLSTPQKLSNNNLEEQTNKKATKFQHQNDKLAREDLVKLKNVCSLFSTVSIPGENGDAPLKTRSGWTNPETLDDLKPLCYLDNKHWKNSKDLNEQIQKAATCFYQLTENLILTGVMQGTKTLGKNITSNDDVLGFFSGFQKSFPTTVKELTPFIPTIQKIMRNLVRYHNETTTTKLLPHYGSLAIGEGKVLGYIQDYYPITLDNSDDYQIFRMPYERFSESKQSVCLSKKGEIIPDTGIVLDHKGFSGFSLMKNAFMYYGAESPFPFTMSPLELFNFSLIQKGNSEENLLISLLGQDYPAPGKTAFIPLPQTIQEKDMVELIFLEDLQEKAKTGDDVVIKMIAYIEEEEGKPLQQIIQELTEEQLKIFEEQELVSKNVANDNIQGKQKKKNKSGHKKKREKKYSESNKQESLPNQQPVRENSEKARFRKELLSEFTNKRVKYRTILDVVNRVMKHAADDNLKEGNKGGSHKTLHSEKGAVTSVKPHGKKSMTIPGKKVKRFTERLLGILDLS